MASTVNLPNNRSHKHQPKKKKSRLFSKAREISDAEQPAAREWIIPNLENWSVDWPRYSPTTTLYESDEASAARDLPPSLRIGSQQSCSQKAGDKRKPGKRSSRRSESWLDLSPEPPTPRCKTEQYLERLPPVKMGRFYRSASLKRQLADPEDYFSWAEEMQCKLSQVKAWPIIEEDMEPVARDSKFHTRWSKINDRAWVLLICNVSKSIRRDLCASWPWDMRGSWLDLREKYGGFAATMMRSVQGVHDMTSLRYKDCSSLSDFLEKMRNCIRAIECNRPESEIDGGVWCRFILAKLGPQWEAWVSGYMMRMQGGESTASSLGMIDQLLEDIEAEEARRLRASRYPAREIVQFGS